jgi:hypothetical protein
MGTFVRLNNAAIAELLTGSSGPVYADIQRRTLKVHASAVEHCPVDTGSLRSSIRWAMAQDNKGVAGLVGTDKIYAQSASDNAKDPSKRDYLLNALKEAV